MAYIIIKTLLTAVIIVGISELGKRYTTFAALLAALPLTSLLAMIWLICRFRLMTEYQPLQWCVFVSIRPWKNIWRHYHE